MAVSVVEVAYQVRSFYTAGKSSSESHIWTSLTFDYQIKTLNKR